MLEQVFQLRLPASLDVTYMYSIPIPPGVVSALDTLFAAYWFSPTCATIRIDW